MQEFEKTTISAYEVKNALLLEQATQALADDLANAPELVADLKARIAENPANWIHGRDRVVCWSCHGTKVVDSPSVLPGEPAQFACGVCDATGYAPEFSLHHGFGTAIRNRLRTLGFTEATMGFDNWDDYYVDVLERAVERL